MNNIELHLLVSPKPDRWFSDAWLALGLVTFFDDRLQSMKRRINRISLPRRVSVFTHEALRTIRIISGS